MSDSWRHDRKSSSEDLNKKAKEFRQQREKAELRLRKEKLEKRLVKM